MFGQEKVVDFQVVATTMMGVVSDSMKVMCSQQFSDGPTVTDKFIYVTDGDKMKANGADKGLFAGCHIASINFFRNEKHREAGKPACGAVIIYFRNDCLVKLFKAMGFPIESEKDIDMLKDVCGEFCNIVAGSFKNELVRLGYANLPMSPPQVSVNAIDAGVYFDEKETKFHELSFYFWNVRAVVVDVTMGRLPLAK